MLCKKYEYVEIDKEYVEEANLSEIKKEIFHNV